MYGYLIATVGVLVGTGLLWMLRNNLSNAHIGLVYLLFVATAAAAGGTRPGVLAAVLSFLLWNFLFLPPLFTFIIQDQRDWILLLVYLIIGLLIGNITGSLRQQEEEARAREQDAAALYHAIQSVAAESNPDTVLNTLVEQVREGTRAAACVIVDKQLEPLAAAGRVDIDHTARRLMEFARRRAKAGG
ncbi:MAG: DUF4118 domain-containing protein, partial [Candidatus Xenobia bacterium]